MNLTATARNLLAKTDLENRWKETELAVLPGEQKTVVRDNAIAAGLELANTIPVLSFASGIATMGYAAFKLGQAANAAAQGWLLAGWVGSGVKGSGAGEYLAQAGKMATLGALATFGGFAGNAINGAAFVKDTADVVNVTTA